MKLIVRPTFKCDGAKWCQFEQEDSEGTREFEERVRKYAMLLIRDDIPFVIERTDINKDAITSGKRWLNQRLIRLVT